MRVTVTNEMTDKQRGDFLRMLKWINLENENSAGYYYVRGLTGCRGYVYGEDPEKYLKLIGSCYNKYCKIYPDEAKRRRKRKRCIDFALTKEGVTKFSEKFVASSKNPNPIEKMDGMEEVHAEALRRDACRTIDLRKKDFRRICEEQGLAKFFE